jgi:hypothetical protein
VPVPVVEKTFTKEVRSQETSRNKFLVPALVVLLLGSAAAFALSRRGNNPAVATAQAPKADSAAGALASAAGAPAANAKAAPVAPVMTAADSLAIMQAVQKRVALAEAKKKPGQAAINADSLKQLVQRATDSAARAKTEAAAAAVAAAPPVAPPTLPTSPAPTGKRRLAIGEPAENKDQPAINSFSRALADAIRSSLDKGESFDPIDQDEVRGAIGRTSSRDEAVGILKPDVLVYPSYTGTGDTVNITVMIRDVKGTSTYGTRMIRAKVMPAYPQYYLDPIVKAVLKQLDELSKAPSIFGR